MKALETSWWLLILKFFRAIVLLTILLFIYRGRGVEKLSCSYYSCNSICFLSIKLWTLLMKKKKRFHLVLELDEKFHAGKIVFHHFHQTYELYFYHYFYWLNLLIFSFLKTPVILRYYFSYLALIIISYRLLLNFLYIYLKIILLFVIISINCT